MLQAFKQTNKQCKWPDCEKIAVKSKLNIKGKTTDNIGMIGSKEASACQTIISLSNA